MATWFLVVVDELFDRNMNIFSNDLKLLQVLACHRVRLYRLTMPITLLMQRHVRAAIICKAKLQKRIF